MSDGQLVGLYDLKSWRRSDGTEPFGADPKGRLWYGADGHMSVQFAASDRTPLGMSLDRLMKLKPMLKTPWKVIANRDLVPALKRFVNGVSNFAAYAGTYEFDGTTVTHRVDIALVPDWEGTDLAREAELDGTTLTLTTPEGDALVWERWDNPRTEGRTERHR